MTVRRGCHPASHLALRPAGPRRGGADHIPGCPILGAEEQGNLHLPPLHAGLAEGMPGGQLPAPWPASPPDGPRRGSSGALGAEETAHPAGAAAQPSASQVDAASRRPPHGTCCAGGEAALEGTPAPHSSRPFFSPLAKAILQGLYPRGQGGAAKASAHPQGSGPANPQDALLS